MIKVSSIKNNPNNPRTINDDKLEKLKRSIKSFPEMMEKRSMVCVTDVDGKLYPLGGNMRLRAIKDLGMKEIPKSWVSMADEWTEEQRREFIIKDNASLGDWDLDDLQENWDLDLISEWGVDLELDEVEELEAEEDDFDVELPEEPKTVLGDLYEIGEHRLLCGDSTCSDTVDKLLNGESDISIYTDPPYGINLKGDNSNRGASTSLMKGGLNLKSFVDDTNQYAIDAFNLTRQYKCKKEVWWGANYYCHSLPESNNWLVWDKRVEEKMRNTNSDCELAYVIDGHNSVRIFRHLWNGLIKASEHGEKRVHPTQKPLALAKYCFNDYEMGSVILDLFLGSGSTMVACEEDGRRCYGMELDPHYCDVIVDRMIKLDPDLRIKRNGVDITNEWN